VSIRWLIWSLLSPSQIILGLVILGGGLLAFGRERLGRRLAIVGGAGLLVFGLLPTSHVLLFPLEERFPAPVLPDEVDGIVLLTGAERPSASAARGEPQLNWAAGRYTSLLRLASRYPEVPIVVTGGPRLDPRFPVPGQTAVAEEILLAAGVAPMRLRFEEASRDTCDNAANVQRQVSPEAGSRWIVVTSALHVPRAVACFRAAGWEIIAQPADYHSALGDRGIGLFQVADNLQLLDMALHEWIGLAYYRLLGRTREWFPAPRIDLTGGGPA
jgi:uncharacterized SAM-binding protein YcdF (DUF218 family)